MQYKLRLAEHKDSASIVQLYHAIIGTPGCTWDEEYPSAEDVAEDIKLSCLYCLEDGIGTLVAVAAAGAFEELSHLSWDARMNKPCELARIGVHPSMQHKGIGAMILKEVIKDCQKRGFDGMRFLVSKTNPGAIALYNKSGFRECGETYMYGHDFYCYQRIFD